MPYIQKTNPETITEQLYQWYGVMTDPRIDGYNGWACKQKIYEIKMECDRILAKENCPTYVDEDKWLAEQREDRAVARLQGRDGIPYVP